MAPIVEPALQDMADWCNVPAPEHTDDTRCLQFFLNGGDTVYRGQLFYRSAPPSISKWNGPHFHGIGYLIPTAPTCQALLDLKLPPTWVRCYLAVNAGFAAGFSFYESDSDGLPGAAAGELETDVDGNNLGFLGLDGPWTLYYTKTTAAMG